MDHVSRVGIFIAVVKHSSFSGAARELGMTGPAVSKQVQSLERKLGVKLLNRTTRHVSATEEGATYYDKARQALEDLNEAEQQILELKTVPTGRLKINAPMSFGTKFLTKPIAKYACQYPEVEVEVDFGDHWVDVIGEGYDIVVRIGALADSNLIARQIAPCPIILCASPILIEKFGIPNSVEQLSTLPGVVYNRHSPKEDWQYQDSKGDIGAQPLNRTMAANTAEMQLEACKSGLGVALLPVFTAHEFLDNGELIRLFPQYRTFPERGIYAMYPPNRYLSARSRLFIDSLIETGRELPWNL